MNVFNCERCNFRTESFYEYNNHKASCIKPHCSLCGRETNNLCGGCGWSFYCSSLCKALHHPVHNAYCKKNFKTMFDEIKNVGIVPCTSSELPIRIITVGTMVSKANGLPCCGICGDTSDTITLKRHGGILICTDCITIQLNMF